MPLERRATPSTLTANDAGILTGYAARWGLPDAYGDVLTRGAFSASLARHRAAGTRPLMLWHHDPTKPIGTWDSVEEDAAGLKVRGRLVLDSTAGRDAHALLKAGALDGLSIGFRTVKATPAAKGRRVEAVDLAEVSLVTRPAQSAARVTEVRSNPVPAGLAALIRHCAARIRKG